MSTQPQEDTDGAPTGLSEQELIYDWNVLDSRRPIARGSRPVLFFDESLRDGIQCPSVVDPKINDKLEILHLMDSLGIQWVDVGLPGAGARAVEDGTRITQEIIDCGLNIQPSAAGRTHINDLRPIVEISQKTGQSLEVMAFLGSSPIRQFAEDWDLNRMIRMAVDAIDFVVREGLPVCFVTEDTVRSRPKTLDALFRAAMDAGATRLCLCDTVGHATPDGVRAIVRFTQSVVDASGNRDRVTLDWHGHNDRGLALTNAIVALESGANRLHGTGIGIGERVGNTSIDQLLLNLQLLGVIDHDLSNLTRYCHKISEAMQVAIPVNYPLAGADAFRTATGVHAAAIIKAQNKGDTWLADRIYSGVPASEFGCGQKIEVGHMSGASNVVYYLRERGIEPSEERVARILDFAKGTNHTLTEDEIMSLV
ncbi:MAG: 2-isopropylmalate synthase [Myxococcota bacterium]|nr:2-isopropylmalate synthase [Myxococcota bacterium]